MQQEMDETFQRFFSDQRDIPLLAGTQETTPTNYHSPLIDLVEQDGKLVATIDLPGVDKKDIEVDIDEQGISISAQKTTETETQDQGIYRKERRHTGFKRNIPLPEGTKPEQASATYKNGVLTIEVPRDEQQTNKKRLTIK